MGQTWYFEHLHLLCRKSAAVDPKISAACPHIFNPSANVLSTGVWASLNSSYVPAFVIQSGQLIQCFTSHTARTMQSHKWQLSSSVQCKNVNDMGGARTRGDVMPPKTSQSWSLEPRMPGRVHSTQVIKAVSGRYQSAHTTVSTFKRRQICTQHQISTSSINHLLITPPKTRHKAQKTIKSSGFYPPKSRIKIERNFPSVLRSGSPNFWLKFSLFWAFSPSPAARNFVTKY